MLKVEPSAPKMHSEPILGWVNPVVMTEDPGLAIRRNDLKGSQSLHKYAL